MFYEFTQVFKREVGYIKGNKRLLIILCVIPIIFTLIFGGIYSEKTIKNLRLGVINDSDSQVSRSLVNSFKMTDTFVVLDEFEKNEVDALLVIPQGFTQAVKKGEGTNVFIGANGSNMSVSSTALRKGAEIIGEDSPITLSLRSWFNPGNNYSDFLLIGYVAATLQQVLMYFVSISITEERRRGSLRELAALQYKGRAVILGKMAPYLLLSLSTWLVCLGLIFQFFTTPMRGEWFSLIVLSILFLLCISSISMFISTMARRSIDATQYAMIVALPSFLLCGYTWPLTAMTDLYKIIAHIFPITYFATNVRSIALMGGDVSYLGMDMMILGSVSLIFILLSISRWNLEFK